MIVLDEQLGHPRLAKKIAEWYPGRVAILNDLRSGSVIKDDAAQTLLRTVSEPTFITINVRHFWRVIRPDSRFAVVCIDLPIDDLEKVSEWLRKFLALNQFRTKAGRMGIVALLRPTQIEFYRVRGKSETIKWDE